MLKGDDNQGISKLAETKSYLIPNTLDRECTHPQNYMKDNKQQT